MKLLGKSKSEWWDLSRLPRDLACATNSNASSPVTQEKRVSEEFVRLVASVNLRSLNPAVILLPYPFRFFVDFSVGTKGRRGLVRGFVLCGVASVIALPFFKLYLVEY